ncbi:hypothetical protein UFOVP579_53 [uncultured Caudovirales phage]|uniref:Uncharacterized protein n=1 Tax=uncultured Caudovirales phage TaxID=2100421 RepID=A0A6J5LPX2_9CAUD|nr:hypothetical protein UFOVP302_53 [uncultured Caudovirales phage]CAB4168768.1 hypothetical protein UFOVP579_53 [uncultured Caudovirales phage]
MKAIQPLNIWTNGTNSQATQLSLLLISDNLESAATFYYQLLSEVELQIAQGIELTRGLEISQGIQPTQKIQLAQGNISLDGDEYQAWGEASDINDAAYEIAADKLGLTLIK